MHDGRTASLVLVKAPGLRADGPGREVLRVWQSNVTLDTGSGKARVWMATATHQRLRHLLSTITVVQSDTDADRPRMALVDSLESGYARRHRPVVDDDDDDDDKVTWDGGVVLARASSIPVVRTKP